MSERTFLTSGLKVARISGIPVWIHWTLFIELAFILHSYWVANADGAAMLMAFWWWIVWLLNITIHELGHCYFAYTMGGRAEEIVLWPLGGLAYCDAPRLAWNQFWLAAGGPIFQLAPVIAAGLGIWILDVQTSFYPSLDDGPLAVLLGVSFWGNLQLLILNVLPIYPLDGGRMFLSILWGRMGSYPRAALATVWTTRAVGLATILYLSLDKGQKSFGTLTIVFLIGALYKNELLRQQVLSGESEDYVFGYDFSRGYTSLERSVRARPETERKPSFRERLHRRTRERKQAKVAALRQRVDALLDRIAREGIASLSPSERKFLDQASRRFKKK